MPKHSIQFDLPQTVRVKNRDVEFQVSSKKQKRGGRFKLQGTLKVSKGSIDWRPSGAEYTRVLSWEKFAALAEEKGSKKHRQ
jgi:hypothetical protein